MAQNKTEEITTTTNTNVLGEQPRNSIGGGAAHQPSNVFDSSFMDLSNTSNYESGNIVIYPKSTSNLSEINDNKDGSITINQRQHNTYALLALALLVVIASAAVLAALYAPEHMPTAITAIVNNLTPFIKDVIMGVAYATGGLGLIGMAYQGTQLARQSSQRNNTFFNQLGAEQVSATSTLKDNNEENSNNITI